MQHKNVLFLGIADSPTMPACLVSPLMEKGNVRSYIFGTQPKNTPTSTCECTFFFVILTVAHLTKIQGTADGIAYLHSQSVIHGDLKGVILYFLL